MIVIKPGTYLVGDASRVVGGKTTRRTQIRDETIGKARETEANLEVRIDNVAERKAAEAFRASVVHVIRSRSAYLPGIGYVANPSGLAEITEEIRRLAREAGDFNASARTCKVEIEIAIAPIGLDLPEAAQWVARQVSGELSALRDAIRAGDASATRAILIRAKGLASVGTGAQGDAIGFALEEGRETFKALAKALKDPQGQTPEQIGGALPTPMLDSAIDLWAPRAPDAGPIVGLADIGQEEV